MTVVELSRYRERRTVRRVAAWVVAIVGVVGALRALHDARGQLERSIRWAAELLPDDVDDEREEAAS